jgi:hypothetical protein
MLEPAPRPHFDPSKCAVALGLRILELRRAKGWTLEECEEHGWKNWRHLQAIESGQNVTLTTIINLSNLFGVHPSELIDSI